MWRFMPISRWSFPVACTIAGIGGILFSCQPATAPNTDQSANKLVAVAPSIAVDLNYDQWKTAINTDTNKLDVIYLPTAISISEEGQVTQRPHPILKTIRANGLQIDTVYTLFQTLAARDSSYLYEVGGFTTSDQQAYRQLVVWKLNNGKALRELEFIAPATNTKPYKDLLDLRRAAWMELCNNHNAQNLVQQLYSANSIYYNHKPILVGREAITNAYQYMNQEEYSLQLDPLFVESVHESLAYEVGQCSGSYGGKYLLVWQKNAEGTWEVLMDSNI